MVVERVGRDAEGQVDLRQALRALSARGVTRIFSEGGPRVGACLMASGLADEVALFTAQKLLGRAGYPALSDEARAMLDDPARYRLVQTAAYGPDRMRLWERLQPRHSPSEDRRSSERPTESG